MGSENAKRQVLFTRCPVGGGTEIILRKGWLQAAYDQVGAEIIMLQSLPKEEHVKHMTQEAPLSFRDGGNVPPIWSRSRGTPTKVIGVTAIKQSHAVLVATDSDVRKPSQLRGKRLSLPKSDTKVVDPMRAMVLRGYDTVLSAYGVGWDEVTFVDIPTGEQHEENGEYPGYHKEEILALRDGRIDAFFSHRSLVGQVEEKGYARVLIDISKTDLSNINNIYPSIITVHADFARENRDLVVIYLKELLKAAEWAPENQEEALQIGAQAQPGATYDHLLSTRSKEAYQAYTPGFDAELLSLLRLQKSFLLKVGVIQQDFDLDEWLDDSFLREAERNE
jgi:ABC-type nitrate/sulfonate/bicarbonate transport system substrate-binding protein